jgi:hypothetical protein
MQTFEYMTFEANPTNVVSVNNGIRVYDSQPYIEFLDNMGKDGWELVSIVNQGSLFRYFLKRPGTSG